MGPFRDIAVERHGWERFVIPAGSRYFTPGEVHVEGDASSASYFIALGAIAGVDAPVRIEGVGAASIRHSRRPAVTNSSSPRWWRSPSRSWSSR